MKKLRFHYIFIFLALILTLTNFALYQKFLATEKKISQLLFQENLSEITHLTDNIKHHIQQNIPKGVEDYYAFLQTHRDVYQDFLEDLELLSMQKYRYIYVLAPLSQRKFRFLIDTSKEDRAAFGETYTPLNPQNYFQLRPHYFFHQDLKNIWLTFVNPIVEDGKIRALIVVDFSMKQAHMIQEALKRLEEYLGYLFIFLLLVVGVVIIFSYFDYKREKEKEKAYRKLEHMNKKLEQMVQQKLEEIREKDAIILNQSKLAAMGEMINMIAHQWRQPLNVISASAINMQLAIQLGNLDAKELEKSALLIQEQAQQMSKVIDDFMNYTKPEKGKERFALQDIVDEVLKMISAQLKNHNIDVIMDIPSKLYLYTYKKDLEHVLLNFLSNARDAIDECGKSERKIYITAFEEQQKVKISIQDSGCGIPPNIQDRIFEPYFTTKEQGKGTGLGLYMSKKIVEEKLGGKLFFTTSSQGTIFTIELMIEK